MQARIIDFASDKIVKSLGKIDKDDVKNIYSSLSSKFTKEGNSSKSVTVKEVNQIESVKVDESSSKLFNQPEESSFDDVDGRKYSSRGFAISLTNSNSCRR